MIELETTNGAEPETLVRDRMPVVERMPFRRRPIPRVLAVAGIIIATIWFINYGDQAGELIHALREEGQATSLVRLLDPLLIARACPTPIVTVLSLVVGFFALLRLKAAAPIERALLQALNAPVGRVTDYVNLKPDGLGSPSYNSVRSGRWIALGLAVVAAALIMLECIEPCYFVQDDNFANVLPGILQGCRAMFHGEFPDFDPCQFMGMPNAGKGLNTLFYPPTIVAYAIARYVLGNENWTLDVFAAMHLLAGYAASFAAARAGLRPPLAFALGISFVLSGYILMVGRGWHAVLTLVVWLPLLFCSMEAWLNGRTGWRWLIASGLAIGGFYYNGFPQYWVYAMLFMGLVALAAAAGGRIAARQLIWPVAALLLGVSLLLPSLIVQLEITRGMAEKEANFGAGFDRGLVATMLPYPLSEAEGFMNLPANRDKELENQWYFAGPILITAGFVVLGFLLAYRVKARWLAQHPWVGAAALSLWLGMGSAGLLWTVFGRLPIIRAVNHHPHRLLPFFTFFMLIVGGQLIERLLRRRPLGDCPDFGHRAQCGRSKNGTVPFTARIGWSAWKWEHAIAAATALLMLWHVSLSRNSLWCYGDRPYPPLPQPVAAAVLPSENPESGRYMWAGPWRSGQPGYAHLLPHSLASAYGALGVGGYDPIVAGRPESLAQQARLDEDPIAAARAYGVRWLLVANAEHYLPERDYWQAVWKHDWCVGYMDPTATSAAEKVIPAANLRADCGDVRLYELRGASPMAFAVEQPNVLLPIRFCGRGADVELPDGAARTVVVNIAMRPWVKAAADSRALVATADSWGRVAVDVPAAARQLEIFYALPWRRGLLLGGGLMLTTIVGMAIMQCRLRDASASR